MKIGFISTRLAGTDGVSLETAKWAKILRRMEHKNFYCAGELEDDSPPGSLIPKIHFHDKENEKISIQAFTPDIYHFQSKEEKDRKINELKLRIEIRATELKKEIEKFINKYNINLIICQKY